MCIYVSVSVSMMSTSTSTSSSTFHVHVHFHVYIHVTVHVHRHKRGHGYPKIRITDIGKLFNPISDTMSDSALNSIFRGFDIRLSEICYTERIFPATDPKTRQCAEDITFPVTMKGDPYIFEPVAVLQ
jgi:hypothetical protein